MSQHYVTDPASALLWMTDCTLATVSSLAGKKRCAKYEFDRQIKIAQAGVDWLTRFKVDLRSTRAAKVVAMGGQVAVWAEQFKPAH